ncbi:hypothetical protein EYZ11_008826 [Aspergillus tanneri]|uniref:Protein kinase domain-containing protein n=1 Tax=Aspergillus tanneri TaxID=1220188 RepID=A0A4S3J9H8_9EURO|nr:uncharacterized protein ATNIH1004_004410 [Aspergillus tanneri]KAA8648525.1 hypothetical protein ATNIH1004_004410 [Aspergillus tanneri]THC91723.1 hypothetical protein EYZ11_008826 [Aspergillus tanneri]
MPETLNKSENNGGTGDRTQSESGVIPLQPPSPPRPGILTVKLGSAYRLSLPDDLDLDDSEAPVPKNTFADPEVCERWRLYAIGEYEGFQVSTEAMAVHATKGAVSWAAWHRPFKFEVSASPSSKLTVSLFVRDSKSNATTSSLGGYENQVVPLGLIRLNPFLETSGEQRVDIQNGTGRVELEVSYTEKEACPLETRAVWSVRGARSSGDLDLVYVEKKDTGRSYGMKVIDIRTVHDVVAPGSEADIDINMAPRLSLRSAIQHPFIAPLKFAFKSSRGTLKLLSPLASGGYLFDHLQRERRFDVNKARFYAAELVSTLEYLHNKHIILISLEPENILLDSSGHVSLCKPGLFGLELGEMGDGDRHRILPGTPKYPAPEVLLDNREASRAVDWWALGIVLYEMLTGIPPFYHKDGDERRHKIINQDLQLPESLPSTARDVLTKLLDKNPLQRLGVNGAAEVKAHPFFHDLKWQECLQRKYTTPFKPHDAAAVFWREPYTYQPIERAEREQREFQGEVYEQIGTTEFPLWLPIGSVNDKSNVIDKKASLDPRDDDKWELTWEPTTQEFHFKNRFTDERVTAKPKVTVRDRIFPPAAEHPSERQKEEALAAALEAGYSKHVFSQILGYGTNLNVWILDYDQTPHGIEIIPNTPDIIPVTPLEWAVVHERLDLVNLFLDNGADANFTISPRKGPALLKAAEKRYHRLVEILVQKTDRVSCTRALALAVEQQDAATANTLLAHGVHCDFKESDRPLPPHPFLWDYDSNLLRELEAEDFTPPLVRAARLGNEDLVALLLEHGANANIAYHDLGDRRCARHHCGYENRDLTIPANFSCGRVVQIAMEMGHSEIVQLLVDAGADINLTHPVWPIPVWPVPGHICQPVPRAVYVEVRAGLEAAVAARREDKT